MRLAIEMAGEHGIGVACARNTHHLGPAGYYAHLAVDHGMLGICMTGHFFGKGNPIGVAPPNSLSAMFSTSPLSLAAPCGRHAPFVLDMATSVATINRIETYAQEALPLPEGWARDMYGAPTTDASAAALLLPLGGSAILGAHKGAGLAMMVSILSCVLSSAWARVVSPAVDEAADAVDGARYEQATMGHFFAAIQIEAFQPLEQFQSAIDAMIDALHAAPTSDPRQRLQYAGEVEAATAKERAIRGIPVSQRLFDELQLLAEMFELDAPQ
jgi:LDH2 family malate/lactate/ureidoglycolate dehydrogenase